MDFLFYIKGTEKRWLWRTREGARMGLSEPRSFCSTKANLQNSSETKDQAGMQCVEEKRDLKESGLKSVMREMWPELRLC